MCDDRCENSDKEIRSTRQPNVLFCSMPHKFFPRNATPCTQRPPPTALFFFFLYLVLRPRHPQCPQSLELASNRSLVRGQLHQLIPIEITKISLIATVSSAVASAICSKQVVTLTVPETCPQTRASFAVLVQATMLPPVTDPARPWSRITQLSILL